MASFEGNPTAHGNVAMSGADIMESTYRESTKKILRLLKGNNDRLNGWGTVREYLKPVMKEEQVIAKLQVFNTCTEFIRTFPSLVYDSIKVEDLNTNGEDHAADAVRYGLMSGPTPSGYNQQQLLQIS